MNNALLRESLFFMFSCIVETFLMNFVSEVLHFFCIVFLTKRQQHVGFSFWIP